jgi:hypothetical protein
MECLDQIPVERVRYGVLDQMVLMLTHHMGEGEDVQASSTNGRGRMARLTNENEERIITYIMNDWKKAIDRSDRQNVEFTPPSPK